MKIGVQTGNIVDSLGFEKGYAAIKKAGFDAIDWNLDHAVKGSDLRNGTYRGTSILEKSLDKVIAYYAEELSYIRKNDLEIYSAHAPFPAYVSQYPDTMDYSIEIYKRNIEYCDFVGCKNLVIHPIIKPYCSSISKEEAQELNLKLYTALIPTLLECKSGVTVCLENAFIMNRSYDGSLSFEPDEYSNPEYAAYIIDKLNGIAGKELFGFCFDVGHANIVDKTPTEFLSVIKHRLHVLHVHDNDKSNDKHLMPFTGNVDWNDFCKALGDIGFKGSIGFETFRQTDKGYEFSEEMSLVLLETIGKTGKLFAERVQKLQQHS